MRTWTYAVLVVAGLGSRASAQPGGSEGDVARTMILATGVLGSEREAATRCPEAVLFASRFVGRTVTSGTVTIDAAGQVARYDAAPTDRLVEVIADRTMSFRVSSFEGDPEAMAGFTRGSVAIECVDLDRGVAESLRRRVRTDQGVVRDILADSRWSGEGFERTSRLELTANPDGSGTMHIRDTGTSFGPHGDLAWVVHTESSGTERDGVGRRHLRAFWRRADGSAYLLAYRTTATTRGGSTRVAGRGRFLRNEVEIGRVDEQQGADFSIARLVVGEEPICLSIEAPLGADLSTLCPPDFQPRHRGLERALEQLQELLE